MNYMGEGRAGDSVSAVSAAGGGCVILPQNTDDEADPARPNRTTHHIGGIVRGTGRAEWNVDGAYKQSRSSYFNNGSVLGIIGFTMIVTFAISFACLRPSSNQRQFPVFHTTGKFGNNTIDRPNMSGYSSIADAGEISGNRVKRTKMSSSDDGERWWVSLLVAVGSGLVVEIFRRSLQRVFPEQW